MDQPVTCSPNTPHSSASGFNRAQDMSHEDIGRVIVRAQLTCEDSNKVDTVLNRHSLRLHLCEREVDAARRFLEEANELKPRVVSRYLDPLAGWLRDGVKNAPHFPEGGHQMW